MLNLRKLMELGVTLSLVAPPICFAQDANKPIEIHVHRFSFQPTEITVHRGEPVVLKLMSDDVTHSLVIKSLRINQTVTKDHPADIRFTPENTGDFRGQCGRFCGSGHGSMFFTVHVR